MSEKNSKMKLKRQRNFLYNHPLLRKCGAHQKSSKSKRRLENVKLKKEWLPQNMFKLIYFEEAIQIDATKLALL